MSSPGLENRNPNRKDDLWLWFVGAQQRQALKATTAVPPSFAPILDASQALLDALCLFLFAQEKKAISALQALPAAELANGELLLAQGHWAAEKGDWQTAADLFRQASQREAHQPICWLNLGIACERLAGEDPERWQEAASAFALFLETATDEGRQIAQLAHAHCLLRAGNTDEAVASVRQFWTLTGQTAGSLAHAVSAAVFQEAGLFAEARTFQAALWFQEAGIAVDEADQVDAATAEDTDSPSAAPQAEGSVSDDALWALANERAEAAIAALREKALAEFEAQQAELAAENEKQAAKLAERQQEERAALEEQLGQWRQELASSRSLQQAALLEFEAEQKAFQERKAARAKLVEEHEAEQHRLRQRQQALQQAQQVRTQQLAASEKGEQEALAQHRQAFATRERQWVELCEETSHLEAGLQQAFADSNPTELRRIARLRQESDPLVARKAEAYAFWVERNWEEAATLFLSLQEAGPDNLAYALGLGVCWIELMEWDEAAAVLRQTATRIGDATGSQEQASGLRQVQDLWLAMIHKGEMLHGQPADWVIAQLEALVASTREAVAQLAQPTESDQHSPQALLEHSLWLLAQRQRKLSDWKGLEATSLRLTALNPTHGAAWYFLAEACAHQENHALAAEHFATAAAHLPNQEGKSALNAEQAKFNRALAQWKGGNFDEAWVEFEALAERLDVANELTTEARVCQLEIALHTGEKERAVAALEWLESLAPLPAEYLLNMGLCFEKSGQIHEAEVLYRRSLDREGEHYETLLNLANLHRSTDPQQALQLFERASALQTAQSAKSEEDE